MGQRWLVAVCLYFIGCAVRAETNKSSVTATLRTKYDGTLHVIGLCY